MVALLVAAPVVGVIPGTVHAAAGDDRTFAVAQGTECTVVEPYADADTNVSTFYDYRNPNTDPAASTYSSYGTTRFQEADGSALLFYAGPSDTSMVVVHGEVGSGAGGSTVTYDVSGLPEGQWAVRDDQYVDSDDDWETSGDTHSVDWKYAPNRTDGGAYRGFDSLDGTTVIEPHYNGEAQYWGQWGYSGSDEYRVTGWTLHSADGSTRSLALDRRVFVHAGGCEVSPPSASVTGPTSAESGETLTFDATATSDDGTVAGYEWDFDGDGTIDAVTRDPTVEHAYNESGEHTVTVTAFDTYGNGDTATATVTVGDANAPPTAALSAPAEATVNGTVTLDASGSTDDAGIVEYRWDVDGDGAVETTTTEPTLETSYAATGEYTPTVTVVDDAGANDTASATVTVTSSEDAPPTTALSAPAETTVNTTVTFDASGSTDDGTITEYAWDFDGDGTVDRTTTEPTTEYAYAAAGEYDASVTATDDANGTDTATATVTVAPAEDAPPTAALSAPAEATVNETVTFDASGSTDDAGIVEYRWDVDGDGAVDRTTTEPTLAHAYTAAGDYAATVTVVDGSNGTATASATVSVTASENAPPTAALSTAGTAAVNETVTLDASGSTDDAGVVEYRWDVDGDGTVETTTTEPTLETSYAATGEYTPTVTVADGAGANDTATATVVVEAAPPPEAALSAPAEATVSETVVLDASASTAAGANVTYEWDVDGDGAVDRTTAEPTVRVAYDAVGRYAATVRVTDERGRTDTANATVEVVPDPEFATNDSEVNVNESVVFSGGDGAGDGDYTWRFGDGTSANGTVVNHTFAAPGSYTVTLEVALGSGTVADTSVSVNVTDGLTENGTDTGTGDTGTPTGGSTDGDGSTDDGSANTPPPSGDTGGTTNDGGTTDDDGGNAPPAGGSDDPSDDDGGNAGPSGSPGGNGGGGAGGGGSGAGSQAADQPDPEPNISQATVELGRRELLEGETLVVTASVNNTGGAAGSKEVEFAVDGDRVAVRRFTLGPGENRTVRFTRTFTEPGNHTLEVDEVTRRVRVRPTEPNVSVTGLDVSDRKPTVGREVTFTAVVANNGTAAGNASVSLELFNETVATRRVRLAPGETKRVTFTREIAASGEFTAVVGNRSVNVSVQPAQDGAASVTAEGTTSTTTPGFGVGAAVGALAATLVALLARARTGSE